MSRETSRGSVPVRLLCETFRLSRQAYYAALQAPAAAAAERPRKERQGDWATASELEAGVRRVVKARSGRTCGGRASWCPTSASGR
jgi:hypothetical protein